MLSSPSGDFALDRHEFQTIEGGFHRLLAEKVAPRAIDRFLKLLRSLSHSEPELKMVRKLLSSIRHPNKGIRPDGDIPECDLPFAESVMTLAGRESTSAEPYSDWSVREIGHNLDFLAQLCFPPHMTVIQALNLIMLQRICPSRKVAVVALVRDEGVCLLEWIAFNRAIGLTDLFIYTNDNSDGSDALLTVLANHRIIRLIRNHLQIGTNPQPKAYQHALHLLHDLRRYKWAMFLDADEFLVLDARYDYNIDNIVDHVESAFRDELPGAVVFPWDWRLSDRAYKRAEGLLFERYPHSIPHCCVKSLTHLRSALSMCEIHVPTLPDGTKIVDSSFRHLSEEAVWGPEAKSDSGGAIAHFWGKSFEEFAIKKKRGELLSLDCEAFSRDFRQYFEWTAILTAENLHPAPDVLLDRVRHHLEELKSLPDVKQAVQLIESTSRIRAKQLERDMKLKSIYKKMSASIPPAMGRISLNEP
jgi:hypothetical protein